MVGNSTDFDAKSWEEGWSWRAKSVRQKESLDVNGSISPMSKSIYHADRCLIVKLSWSKRSSYDPLQGEREGWADALIFFVFRVWFRCGFCHQRFASDGTALLAECESINPQYSACQRTYVKCSLSGAFHYRDEGSSTERNRYKKCIETVPWTDALDFLATFTRLLSDEISFLRSAERSCLSSFVFHCFNHHQDNIIPADNI